jgi:hypothetical protein
MKKLLAEGDVVFLKKGMRVYTQVPEKFVYANAKLSKGTTSHDINIGSVMTNETDISEDRKELASHIVEGFDSHFGVKLAMADALEFINSKIKTPKESSFVVEEGEFLVTKTINDGGGFGMGRNDYYPNGHHVYCKRLNADGSFNEKGIEVNFYQTGSFTAMIEPKKLSVLRTMAKNFA